MQSRAKECFVDVDDDDNDDLDDVVIVMSSGNNNKKSIPETVSERMVSGIPNAKKRQRGSEDDDDDALKLERVEPKSETTAKNDNPISSDMRTKQLAPNKSRPSFLQNIASVSSTGATTTTAVSSSNQQQSSSLVSTNSLSSSSGGLVLTQMTQHNSSEQHELPPQGVEEDSLMRKMQSSHDGMNITRHPSKEGLFKASLIFQPKAKVPDMMAKFVKITPSASVAARRERMERKGLYIYGGGVGVSVKDKGSIFQAFFITHADLTMEDIADARNELRSDRDLAAATHTAMEAHRLSSGTEGFDDDGETGAGEKMLRWLRGSMRDHASLFFRRGGVAIFVTRWFGGVLLGPRRFDRIIEAIELTLQSHIH